MPTLENSATATAITVDMTSMESAFQDPKFKTMIASGYKIVNVIPVTDEGRPLAIFIFAPREPTLSAVRAEWWARILFLSLVAIFGGLCAVIYQLSTLT